MLKTLHTKHAKGGDLGCFEGDQSAAFVEIITQHQRMLYGYIYTLVRNSADAEDLLQETNLVLWNKRSECESVKNFSAWACRIAFFKVQNFLKTRGRSRVCFNENLISKISEMQIDRADMHMINSAMLVNCLEKLSSASQQLLKLCYDENHTIQEVAKQLDRPVGSIYNSLRQIRLKLWKCIKHAIIKDGSI
jgi:RNA polymerase sigma-70 factor, ECF subfamily